MIINLLSVLLVIAAVFVFVALTSERPPGPPRL